MRGQPCPIPVVNAKKALADEGASGVIVIVDNYIAVQNLEKMARGTGCGFSYISGKEDGSAFDVHIIKSESFNQDDTRVLQPSDIAKKTDETAGATSQPVVLITANSMGRGTQSAGDESLGQLLVKGFIFSLTQLNPLPDTVIFLNSGVKLAAEGANTVPDLKELEKNGVKVFVCGTCVNYYKLTESLAIGSIIDMMSITNMLAKAPNLITI